MVLHTKIEKVTTIDDEGREQSTIKESTVKKERITEPDYIKIYTNMWCEFNAIPVVYRDLFFQLAIRMTYANPMKNEGGQIVYTFSPTCDSIMNELGWKRSMFHKGIKSLTEVGAIRKISRGIYQINPNYAGKGEWKYNPRLERGGIEDLVAKFKFKDKTIETEIIWADDGSEKEINKIYRDGLKVKGTDNTVLKSVSAIAIPTSTPSSAVPTTAALATTKDEKEPEQLSLL